MPVLDVDLILDSANTVLADGNTTPIDVEGGFLCWAKLQLGAVAGTSLDVRVQASYDGGSNYVQVGKFQQIGASDDNDYMAIPVYIARPDKPAAIDYQPQPFYTKVRLNYDITTPSTGNVITKAWLAPMLSLAVEAIDEALTQGAASRNGAGL